MDLGPSSFEMYGVEEIYFAGATPPPSNMSSTCTLDTLRKPQHGSNSGSINKVLFWCGSCHEAVLK